MSAAKCSVTQLCCMLVWLTQENRWFAHPSGFIRVTVYPCGYIKESNVCRYTDQHRCSGYLLAMGNATSRDLSGPYTPFSTFAFLHAVHWPVPTSDKPLILFINPQREINIASTCAST